MNKIIIILSILFTTTLFSQEVQKDTIDTEEINIIKPYTPKIKDAFKIKKSPQQGDDDINQKKEVQYSINSVPVASTFTPSKGKAKGVARKKKERFYDNYISLGFGNYTTPKIEAFAHSSTTRNNDFGATLNFHSTKGDVKDAVLDTNFSHANLDLFYRNSTRDMDWQLNGGYKYQQQNWYGLNDTFTDTVIETIDEKQAYNTIKLGGNIDYYEAFFKGADLDINIFTDKYKSKELHTLVTPKFQIPIAGELFDTNFRMEYIAGKFDQNYATDDEKKYGFYNLGVSPSLKILRDYLTLNLGANLVYSGATQGTLENKFFIYPNVTASYELIQDVMTLYASATGDLHQQSYRNFVNENPYVSPTLNVRRTHEKYNAKIGTKGKLASTISFNINASYKDENAKPLMKLNPDMSSLATPNSYHYANSFSVLYDNVQTLGFFGELTADLSKELSVGINANYNSYTTEIQEKAWNLPAIKSNIFLNYNTKKFFAGANVFIEDEKYDFLTEAVKVKPGIDLNANLGYNFSNRLTAFVNGNNLLGQKYNNYLGYQVQGIQVLGGVKFKFDL